MVAIPHTGRAIAVALLTLFALTALSTPVAAIDVIDPDDPPVIDPGDPAPEFIIIQHGPVNGIIILDSHGTGGHISIITQNREKEVIIGTNG